jgi:hypothetical protein
VSFLDHAGTSYLLVADQQAGLVWDWNPHEYSGRTDIESESNPTISILIFLLKTKKAGKQTYLCDHQMRMLADVFIRSIDNFVESNGGTDLQFTLLPISRSCNWISTKLEMSAKFKGSKQDIHT